MKSLLLVFSSYLMVSIAFPSQDFSKKINCKHSRCSVEKVEFNISKLENLKAEDIIVNDCLVNLEDWSTYKILSFSKSTNDIELVRELQNDTVEKIKYNFDSQKFNKKLRIISCELVRSKYFLDREIMKSCLDAKYSTVDDYVICFNWKEKYKK